MSEVWLDGFDQVQGKRSGGSWQAGAAPKHVGHTTEGLSRNPHGSAAAHPYPPHTWYTPAHHPYKPRQKIQILPLNRSGYALAHPSGTPETNRAGAIQTEVEDFASKTPAWSQYSLDCYVEDLIVPICEACAIDPRNFLPTADSSGYGTSGAVRVPASTMFGFNGLTVHANWHANSHWDQGDIWIEYISAKAAEIMFPAIPPPPPPPTPPPVDPGPTPEEVAEFLRAVQRWRFQVACNV